MHAFLQKLNLLVRVLHHHTCWLFFLSRWWINKDSTILSTFDHVFLIEILKISFFFLELPAMDHGSSSWLLSQNQRIPMSSSLEEYSRPSLLLFCIYRSVIPCAFFHSSLHPFLSHSHPEWKRREETWGDHHAVRR